MTCLMLVDDCWRWMFDGARPAVRHLASVLIQAGTPAVSDLSGALSIPSEPFQPTSSSADGSSFANEICMFKSFVEAHQCDDKGLESVTLGAGFRWRFEKHRHSVWGLWNSAYDIWYIRSHAVFSHPKAECWTWLFKRIQCDEVITNNPPKTGAGFQRIDRHRTLIAYYSTKADCVSIEDREM